jgi:hypothetical protein
LARAVDQSRWQVAAVLVVLAVASFLAGCSDRGRTRDLVSDTTSPDGRVDAVLYETDCGPLCSFGFEVWLAPQGSSSGDNVAFLYSAFQNEHDPGVVLEWVDATHLSINYLKAEQATLLKPHLIVAGHGVNVSLRDGVSAMDPTHPSK